MTDVSMQLFQLLDKTGITLDDQLREVIRVYVQALMEAEVTKRIGAEPYERSEERVTQRNGYRERPWKTRMGEITLAVPKLREGSYFPSMLEPRRMAEKALLAAVQTAYVEGVSTRKVEQLMATLGLPKMDKSQVSRNCKELDEAVHAFLDRPLEREFPYLWLDATYLKVRQNHRIVSMAGVVAIGVSSTGEREVLGFGVGASEEASFWVQFLRKLVERNLHGVQAARSASRDQRCPSGSQGGHQPGADRSHVAALPGASDAQRAGPCEQGWASHRRGTLESDLRAAESVGGRRSTGTGGRHAGGPLAEGRSRLAGGQRGCSGLHGLSARTLE